MTKHTDSVKKAAATNNKGPRPCACSLYTEVTNQGEFDESTGDLVGFEETGTGCESLVAGRSEFKQGHDAKLKSLMIRAGRAGNEVSRQEGGMRVGGSAETMSRGFGFHAQVLAGIAKGLERAERKAEKAEKKAGQGVLSLTGRKVRIKVGRWDYEGWIHSVAVDENGNESDEVTEFGYNTKSGEEKIVTADKVARYTFINGRVS